MDVLKRIVRQGDQLMALAKSSQDKLDALSAALTAAAAGLSADIASLKDAIANAGPSTPEVDAALDSLASKVQAFTDLDAQTP